MDKEQLKHILEEHAKWINSEDGANRADLRGAKGAIVGPQRTDGYRFDLSQGRNGRWVVVAECHRMSIAKYRQRVKTYDCADKKAETTAILDYLEAGLRRVKGKSK